MAGNVYRDLEGNTRLSTHVRTAAHAWAFIRAVARERTFTTVTPQMIADGASPRYSTPLVLFATPYVFELCYVRSDGYVGLCFLTIAITEPHNAPSNPPRELLQGAVGSLDTSTAAGLDSLPLRANSQFERAMPALRGGQAE